MHTPLMGVSARRFVFGDAFDRGAAAADSDEHLVARVRAGDDLAFEAIYDRYARGLLAFCAQLLGSREAAEDALQFTFVAAFRALRRGDEREIALRPWLYTIARNRCISDLRGRREAACCDGVLDELRGGDAPLVQVQRREELRELLADMQRLPADQRAALALFELGDQSHAEIADVLGVRREKVKALIFQAREALVRGRKARERPCAEVREYLATADGRLLPRNMIRAHIDRCPACAAFEAEVARQRAAFAPLVLLVAAGKLKASVLRSALGGGGGVATPTLATGGGGALAGGGGTSAGGGGATAGGGGTLAGGGASTAAAGAGAGGTTVAAGGVTTTTGGATVAAGGTATTVGASGATGVGAVAAGTGTAAGGAGLLGMAATPVAKLMSAVAITTGIAGARHVIEPVRNVSPAAIYRQAPPATPAVPVVASPGSVPPAAASPAATSSTPTPDETVSATPAQAPTPAPTGGSSAPAAGSNASLAARRAS